MASQFRPVIMITLAAVLGMLPLAMSNGLGTEMGKGIGVASVGGIAVSAFMTMLIVPVLYLLTVRKPKGGPAGKVDAFEAEDTNVT